MSYLPYALAVWLLVVGVRSVHGWTWGRAFAACLFALAAPIVAGLLLSSL